MTAFRPFVEEHPWELGFAAIYRTEILPRLEAIETERARVWGRRRHWAKGFLILSPIALVAGLLSPLYHSAWPSWMIMGFIAAVFCLAISFGIFVTADKGHRERVTAIVLPPVLRFVSAIEVHRRGVTRTQFPTLDVLRDLGLVPRWTGVRIDDLFDGQHGGRRFQLAELTLTYARTRSTPGNRNERKVSIVFAGIVIQLERPEGDGPGLLLLPPDADPPETLPPGAKRIELPDGPLAGRVSAFAADADEVTRALPDARQQALARWLDQLGNMRAQIAFARDQVYVTVKSLGDKFGAGRIQTSLAELDREVHVLLAELTLPQRLLDALEAREEAADAAQPGH